MRLRRILPALAASALLAACAPTQSGPAAAGGDEQTGTVRVWLFDEANRAPKEAAVKDAIAEFKAAHQGVEVDVQWVPVEGRADKFSGAFNDPANAPDVAEFGNTDVSAYAATGALADLTGDLSSWPERNDLVRVGPCSKIPGIAFRTLQRDTAIDHQHLAGDIAGIIAEQKFHGVADVPAGSFRLQHRGVGALGARSLAHAVAAGVDHRRVHRTRANAVDPDVVAAVIDRHRLG